MSDRPELLDYMAFFEAEPTILHPEIGWFVGAQFDSVRGEHRIRAMVAPDETLFSFKWWHKDLPCADLVLQGVVSWIIDSKSGRENLLLKFHQDAVEYFIIQLKPNITVSCVIR